MSGGGNGGKGDSDWKSFSQGTNLHLRSPGTVSLFLKSTASAIAPSAFFSLPIELPQDILTSFYVRTRLSAVPKLRNPAQASINTNPPLQSISPRTLPFFLLSFSSPVFPPGASRSTLGKKHGDRILPPMLLPLAELSKCFRSCPR